MGIAVDDLQVRQPPEIKELRPGEIAMLAPDAEQWRPVVNLGRLPQPSPGAGAAPALQLAEQLGLGVWCVPHLPGRNAGRMPHGILVRATIPKIGMPAEAVDGLPTDAAGPRSARERVLTIGRRRRAEARR